MRAQGDLLLAFVDGADDRAPSGRAPIAVLVGRLEARGCADAARRLAANPPGSGWLVALTAGGFDVLPDRRAA